MLKLPEVDPKLLGITEPNAFVGLPKPEVFVLAPNVGGFVFALPKPADGAADPNTGPVVFVPKDEAVVFPYSGLLSSPKPGVLKLLC